MYVCNLRVLNMILKGYSSSGSGCSGGSDSLIVQVEIVSRPGFVSVCHLKGF